MTEIRMIGAKGGRAEEFIFRVDDERVFTVRTPAEKPLTLERLETLMRRAFDERDDD
jgi:hypothetical protein